MVSRPVLIVAFLLTMLCGCPSQQGQDPEQNQNSGPVVVAGPGFKVTLPEGSVPENPPIDIPGASFLAFYSDQF